MKSFFLVPAVAISTVLMLIAIAGAIVADHGRLAWVAAAVANLPLPLFWLRLRFARVPRTSADLPLLIFVSAAGGIITLWQAYIARAAAWQPSAIAVTGTVLLLLYIFWYSRLGRMPNARLEIRNKLPEFELSDLEGVPVRSSEFHGSPTVWLFYRGNWDPFCVAQVHEIAGRLPDLEKLGVQLNLVSSQPAEKARELASGLTAPVRFLIDRNAEVSEALDIAERHAVPAGTTAGYARVGAMPTTIVTSASGTILFVDQTDNYRVRPEPDLYISILRRAGAVAQ